MKLWWKAVGALALLSLGLWWVRADDWQQDRVSAAPLPPAPDHAVSPSPPRVAASSWRQDALWDDGKAEFCVYQASWARYGHVYPGRALTVLVKEPWNAKLDVKADDPAAPGGFDVLKLNLVRDVPTGIYTYHQMASVYLRRDSGALRKLAATSSEACGISTAEAVGGRLTTHSYFDGQGDRTQPWPAEAVPEDGLPASLRDAVAGAAPDRLAVFPSLMESRFGPLGPVTYRLERREMAPLDTPLGAATPAVEIRLTAGRSVLAYVFERAAPHRLLRFERDDGTLYRLAKCDRLAYWQMHDPGGEAWLPAGLR